MKDVKLRAWDRESKIMRFAGKFDNIDTDGNDRIYNVYFVPSTFENYIIQITVLDNGEIDTEVFRGELLEFTGLIDKNGIEIHEGDVVTDGTLIAKVVFEAPSFIAKVSDFIDLSHKGYVDLLEIAGIEIIGNTYENPELLGAKQ